MDMLPGALAIVFVLALVWAFTRAARWHGQSAPSYRYAGGDAGGGGMSGGGFGGGDCGGGDGGGC